MQKNFGQSRVDIVTLPNGNQVDNQVDCRNLGATRANLHTNNNRLQEVTSTAGMYLPGMIDHQHPDFSNPTQDYFIAASQKPSIADTFLSPIFDSVLAGSRRGQERSDSGNASEDGGGMMGPQPSGRSVICLDGTTHVTTAANQQSHPDKFASMEDGGCKMGQG